MSRIIKKPMSQKERREARERKQQAEAPKRQEAEESEESDADDLPPSTRPLTNFKTNPYRPNPAVVRPKQILYNLSQPLPPGNRSQYPHPPHMPSPGAHQQYVSGFTTIQNPLSSTTQSMLTDFTQPMSIDEDDLRKFIRTENAPLVKFGNPALQATSFGFDTPRTDVNFDGNPFKPSKPVIIVNIEKEPDQKHGRAR
jgi:hypothetical protein